MDLKWIEKWYANQALIMKIVSHMTIVLTNVKSRFALSRHYWGMLDKVVIVKEWRMKPAATIKNRKINNIYYIR